MYRTKKTVYGAPCVGEDETVYVSSWDGYLSAISPDGSLRWEFLTKKGDQIWGSPALAPCNNCSTDIVYIGANKALMAVELNAARQPVLKWAVQTKAAIFASPTVDAAGVVYIGGLDGNFRAVSANGTVLWEHKSNFIYASAAVSETTVFFATMKGEVIALTKDAGKEQWTAQPSKEAVTSSPSLSPDGAVLYSASQDGQLRAFSTADGKMAWEYKVGFVDGSSPAVAADGTVYIGSLDSHLYAVNASGALRWKFKADGQVQSAPAIGAGGRLYFNSFKGTVYSLDAADGTVQWKGKLNSSSFSSPALGRRGLYVGATDGVAAFVAGS
jgi:outer membrane protein assembly factor BamB